MSAISAASASQPKPDNNSWSIYRRLLRYARPYVGVFMIGVLGMVLFAATNIGLAYVVKQFVSGAFVKRDPQVLWQVPVGVVVLFTLRGIGDFVANYYPSWVGRQVIKGLRRDVFSHYLRLPTAYLDRQQSGHLLSKLTNNIELVAAAATSASISLIGDSLSIVGLLAYTVLHELAAGGVLHRRRAGHRLADADCQPQLSALQRAHPEFHGRHHARRQGGDRCPSVDQDLQRRGSPDRAVRAGQRAESSART